MSDQTKRKWPRAEALELAEALAAALSPAVEDVLICGSLRRGKPLVGDVELVYVPKLAAGRSEDMFAPPTPSNLADVLLDAMLGQASSRSGKT